MYSFYVTKIKMLFSLAVFGMGALVIAGSFYIEDNVYFTERYIDSQVDYYGYSLASLELGSLGQMAAGVFAISPAENRQEVVSVRNHAEYIPVLAYHRLVKEFDGSNVTESIFKEQMQVLKDNGYNTVTVKDLLLFLNGQKKLPEKSFVLTFDDGAKDSFYPVDSILRLHDYTAVNMIITARSFDYGNDVYYLSKPELEVMIESGRWEIGSHTRNSHDQVQISADGSLGNSLVNRIWLPEPGRLETEAEYEARIFSDLSASKRALEEALGVPIISFAFPFGDYGQGSYNVENVEEILQEIVFDHYNIAFYQAGSQESIRNHPEPGKEDFYVRRIKVDPSWSGEELLEKMLSN